MNLKNAIESLRTELRKFSTQKQSFADYKLTDGTVVRVDGDLVAGTAVYVVAEDGTLPAPDGEHVVEGVGTIKTEGGKIVEVIAAEVPVAAQEVEIEVAPEEPEAPEMPEAPWPTSLRRFPNSQPRPQKQAVQQSLSSARLRHRRTSTHSHKHFNHSKKTKPLNPH